MANQEHLDILKQGVKVWNEWRRKTADAWFDLSQTDLSEVNLLGANLRRGTLRGANLNGAYLNGTDLSWTELSETDLKESDLRFVHAVDASFCQADLSDAVLIETNLSGSNFYMANLTRANLFGSDLNDTVFAEANLSNANLIGARLGGTNLSGANLSFANLSETTLLRTNFTGATLTNCRIYGISAWDVELKEAMQNSLIITGYDQPTITVDNLEVAQFIYLLLNNQKIRDVIDTIASKVVLILGRFTPRRKAILDALKEELCKQNYSPVVFDFDRPENRDFTETARTLAHMSRFILADITEPSSIPQELQAIVPDLEVPVQPLLEEGEKQYAIFPDLRKYSWVFPVYHYKDQASLIASLKKEIIEPADKKARELAVEKARRLERP